MAGFYGTEEQQALQRRTHEMRDWIASTPGIYNAGRFIGVDDPDRVPEPQIEEMLARDGLIGFRMISPAQADRIFPPLAAKGYRIDTWDILVGTPDTAGVEAGAITGRPVPEGITVQTILDGPEGKDTVEVQRFLATAGLAPFPGSMLAETPPRARTIVLRVGRHIIATGHAYFPHNAHSRFRNYAWIGLITVGETWRGLTFGRLISAMLVEAAFDELGASHVYEMIAPSNLPSRRMAEACGLKFDPTLRCGVAVPHDAARFTR